MTMPRSDVMERARNRFQDWLTKQMDQPSQDPLEEHYEWALRSVAEKLGAEPEGPLRVLGPVWEKLLKDIASPASSRILREVSEASLRELRYILSTEITRAILEVEEAAYYARIGHREPGSLIAAIREVERLKKLREKVEESRHLPRTPKDSNRETES